MQFLRSVLERVFGHGPELDLLQMGSRSLVLFFIALALVRIAGMRAFGARSPFDLIVVIMLGAVLSRALVGASPFWSTVVAAAVLVGVHRVLAIVAARSRPLARLINGRPLPVKRDGACDVAAMHRHGISARDLDAAARREAHRRGADGVTEIWLENSGELTVVDE